MIALTPIFMLTALQGSVGEVWGELAQLAPGVERGQRVASLLEASQEPLDLAAQQLAFEAGARAAENFELDLALQIQAALHGRVQASWSAFNLALTLQEAGQVAAADDVYAQLLDGADQATQAPLWSQRGILALGAGQAVSGRAYLGRALALGNLDAAAVLARTSFARHNLLASKNGFRSVLLRSQAHPWALRGWGLSIVLAHR